MSITQKCITGKITRSVKESNVIGFSLTIYTLLRHRRTFVKVGEHTLLLRNSLSDEATRDERKDPTQSVYGRRNATSLLDIFIDKRKNLLQISLFPRRWLRRSDHSWRKNSCANTFYKEMGRFELIRLTVYKIYQDRYIDFL